MAIELLIPGCSGKPTWVGGLKPEGFASRVCRRDPVAWAGPSALRGLLRMRSELAAGLQSSAFNLSFTIWKRSPA
jgi:hypothetical protein